MACLCSKCTNRNCPKKKNLAKRVLGKKNRNTGRYTEHKLLKLFQDWNIELKQTVASGQLKSVADRVNENKELFVSDFYSKELLKGKIIRIENKKRQFSTVKKYYNATNEHTLYIKDFCYIVTQKVFKDILDKNYDYEIVQTEDKGHKQLHNFFKQDNAEIVSLIAPNENGNRYKDFLFCIKKDIFEELTGGIKHD